MLSSYRQQVKMFYRRRPKSPWVNATEIMMSPMYPTLATLGPSPAKKFLCRTYTACASRR